MGKYYVSTKGTPSPVLKAYVHKKAREGENFTGNFNEICQHISIFNIKFQGKIIVKLKHWKNWA